MHLFVCLSLFNIMYSTKNKKMIWYHNNASLSVDTEKCHNTVQYLHLKTAELNVGKQKKKNIDNTNNTSAKLHFTA